MGPALALAMCGHAIANPAGGNPKADGRGWRAEAGAHGVQRLVTPGIDRLALQKDDLARERKGLPPRFAQPLAQRITPATHGTWDAPEPGLRRWRIEIASAGAVSLNLGFAKYKLPEGATLRVLDGNGTLAMRAFDARDNDAHGQLWTPIVPGDALSLELRVPAGRVDAVSLELASVNHGYRDFAETTQEKSGACNIDVACPQGDAWRDPIRSTVALHYEGAINCTGAIVNNTAQDLKGYLLTAAHCGLTSGNAATLVTYFNFENATCRSAATSGGVGNGPLTEFNTGSSFRAARAQSDFTLLELDDPIDPAFDVHWAGFDARNQVTASAVAVHHPSGDEKRISFENAPTTITAYSGTASPGDGTHLRITDWDLGTTEPGSSGSPLFSPEQRIVGQLHGGGAACGNDLSDWYGRLATSWNAGSTSATRLRDWLDPGDGTTLVLDGRDAVEGAFRVSVAPNNATVCSTQGNAQFNVGVIADVPGFVDAVTLTTSGAPAGLGTAISPSTRTPGQVATLTLSNLAALSAGTHQLDVVGTRGADSDTERLAFTLVPAAPTAPALVSPANGSAGISPGVLAWSAVASAASYRVELSTSPTFATTVLDEVVTQTQVAVPALQPQTTYFWRVTPSNGCGNGARSATASFTTNADHCAAPALDIPDSNATGVSSAITLAGTTPIVKLEVVLQVEHSYTGDLLGTLSHAGVASRSIFDPPNGCSGRDPDVILDDAAALSIAGNCLSGDAAAYTPGTAYRPAQTLAAFQGHAIGGTWTLRLSDLAGDDVGRLQRWCLRPTFAAAPGPLLRDGFED